MGSDLKMNSFCHFFCQDTDQKTGDHAGDQKYRRVIKKTGVFHDQGSYHQLTDIVGHASCHADAENAEAGAFFHKSHDKEA